MGRKPRQCLQYRWRITLTRFELPVPPYLRKMNPLTKIITLSLLSSWGGAVVWAEEQTNAPHKEEASDMLRFANHDTLHGEFIAFNSKGNLQWKSPESPDPIVFETQKAHRIILNHGQAHKAIDVKDETLDPLASLFYIRKQPLAENLEIIKSVTDGKKVVRGVARVVRREKLIVSGIEYDTFLVEPDLKEVRGVFEKSRKSRLKLWITGDDRRLLVKIRSKVAVGSFTGTLVETSVSL
jgi:hypothetical protein